MTTPNLNLGDPDLERRIAMLDFIAQAQDDFIEFFEGLRSLVYARHQVTDEQAEALGHVLPPLSTALFANAFIVAGAGMAMNDEQPLPQSWLEVGDLFMEVANGYKQLLREYIAEQVEHNE